MQLKFLLFAIIFNWVNADAQDLTAYTDNRDNLQVFDRGLSRQLEYLPVANYKIGGNSIAYIDNKNDFKIYYDGQSHKIMNAADFWYTVTNNITAFRVGSVLYAFDKGEKKTLTYFASIVTVDDSVMAFF